MRSHASVVAGLLALASALQAQQPQQAQAPPQPQDQRSQARQTQGREPPIVVYRIDLVPTGSAFSMNEPTLEGDVYVFRALPERTIARLPKAKVKAITRRSTDYSKEVVFQVDFAPTGSVLVRDEPVKKGSTYLLTTWRQGALLSVREADILKITRLTGFPAFKAEMTELGVVVIEGETPAGFKEGATGGATGTGAGSAPSASAPSTKSGNWTYQGTPGSSDAYAPGGGTVSRPGDTPMMPTPQSPR